jgi:iron complex transport system substrate-binding protein
MIWAMPMSTQTSQTTTDDTGTAIFLKQPAQRIVCLSATGIDILSELGLVPIGYLSKGIADRPEFYGEAAHQIAPVGSWMFPKINQIKALQPDLIIGWAFPHRFYQPWLNQIAPVYLMKGNNYTATLQRLRNLASLCDRTIEAERMIDQFEQSLEIHRRIAAAHAPKTVLMMGGSMLNRWMGKFLVETDKSALGSLLQQLTHYPWHEPEQHRGEPGLITLSLREILTNNPDIIFVQTYSPSKVPLSQQLAHHPQWQQLKAVQTQKVYEVDQFWHMGTGIRMLNLILNQLMSKIYPQN